MKSQNLGGLDPIKLDEVFQKAQAPTYQPLQQVNLEQRLVLGGSGYPAWGPQPHSYVG